MLAQENTPGATPSPSPAVVDTAETKLSGNQTQPSGDKTVETKRSPDKSTPVASSRANTAQPSSAYDMDAIKAFDDALYGP